MAEVRATKAGNWSDTTVWSTGALPQSGDDVYANNFAVTINQTVNLGAGGINTRAGSVAVAGGSFTMSTAYDFTGYTNSGTSICFIISASTGTINIVGNISCSGNFSGINRTGAANVNITGNASGGSGAGTAGVINNATSGTITITGNSTAGVSGAGFLNNVTGTCVLNGNSTGSNNNAIYGCQNASTGTFTVNGVSTGGGISTGHGSYNSGAGTMTITTAVGSSTSSANGAYNAGLGTMTITTAKGSQSTTNASHGAVNNSTGTMIVTNAEGGLSTTGGASYGVVGTVYQGTTSVKNATFGSSGQCPFFGFIKWENGIDNILTVYKKNGSTTVLQDLANVAAVMPANSDVRLGTVFNSGNNTGTLAVPPVGSVGLGVPTDNTTGTAVFSGDSLWSILTSTMTTSGSIGKLIKDYLDAAVSSRLASSSYSDAPSAEAIKAEVETSLVLAKKESLVTMNEGIKLASNIIPYNENI